MTTITSVVWLMCLIYGIGWGIYLAIAARDYYRLSRQPVAGREEDDPSLREAMQRRRMDLVASVRYLVIAICMFMFPASFFFRTSLVLLGLGDAAAGQITFFALAGVNALGCIIAITTKLRPRWFM